MAVVANGPVAAEGLRCRVRKKTSEPWPTQHFVTTYGDM